MTNSHDNNNNISNDMNYSSKHDSQHTPTVNSWSIIKSSCNQPNSTNCNISYNILEIGIGNCIDV